MMKILTWFLLASICLGGWDEEMFPVYETQRNGREIAQAHYNAIKERCDVTSLATGGAVSPPSEPSWWRSQHSMLVNQKAVVKALIPKFVVWHENKSAYISYLNTYWSYPNPYIDEFGYSLWGPNHEYSYSDFPWHCLPRLSVTNILISHGLPTNYFDYTPWRCLNGWGPFVNGTNRPSGWTNSFTAKGGTNSNWTTTDYGWHGLRECIDELVCNEFYTRVNDYTNSNANAGYDVLTYPHTLGAEAKPDWDEGPAANGFTAFKGGLDFYFGSLMHVDENTYPYGALYGNYTDAKIVLPGALHAYATVFIETEAYPATVPTFSNYGSPIEFDEGWNVASGLIGMIYTNSTDNSLTNTVDVDAYFSVAGSASNVFSTVTYGSSDRTLMAIRPEWPSSYAGYYPTNYSKGFKSEFHTVLVEWGFDYGGVVDEGPFYTNSDWHLHGSFTNRFAH